MIDGLGTPERREHYRRHAAHVHSLAEPEAPLRPPGPASKLLGAAVVIAVAALPLLFPGSPYALVLGIDVLIAVLFATSLHFIMGPGGMHSFGHAAYFGLGAYGAALLVKWFALPMPPAATVGVARSVSAFSRVSRSVCPRT